MDLVLGDMEGSAKQLIAAAVGKAHKKGLLATGEMRCGVAAFEILKYAKDFGADAIVMGTHGRGGLKRLFMGSVAETVLREAVVPVIIVRERERVPAHS
jgi:nucleotide-binding universal stress UspA family protein